MNKNILKISFSRLKKQEVKQLASRVIIAVEGFNPETLQIKEIYDFLVELEPQIESLKLGYISHPISIELIALRKQRIALANGIIDQMKIIENGKISDMGDAVKVALPIVLKYLQSFWSCDEAAVYQNFQTFLWVFANDAALLTAF